MILLHLKESHLIFHNLQIHLLPDPHRKCRQSKIRILFNLPKNCPQLTYLRHLYNQGREIFFQNTLWFERLLHKVVFVFKPRSLYRFRSVLEMRVFSNKFSDHDRDGHDHLFNKTGDNCQVILAPVSGEKKCTVKGIPFGFA